MNNERIIDHLVTFSGVPRQRCWLFDPTLRRFTLVQGEKMSSIAKIEDKAMAVAEPAIDSLQLIQTAVDKGMSPEILGQLLTLTERIREGQAREAFYKARAEFQAAVAQNPPKKTKPRYGNVRNPDTGKWEQGIM